MGFFADDGTLSSSRLAYLFTLPLTNNFIWEPIYKYNPNTVCIKRIKIIGCRPLVFQCIMTHVCSSEKTTKTKHRCD